MADIETGLVRGARQNHQDTFVSDGYKTIRKGCLMVAKLSGKVVWWLQNHKDALCLMVISVVYISNQEKGVSTAELQIKEDAIVEDKCLHAFPRL